MWEGWETGSVTSATECKYHLSCNCDFVVKYNNIQHANANIAGNGDHTNSAVAPTKAYKSVKDYPELSVVNQNQVVTISDVCDLHIKGLERNGSPNPNSMGYELLTCFTRRPQVVVTSAFPTWSLETKAVFVICHVDPRYRNWECSMTGSLRPFSEEAPILDLLHDYACSKICIVVAIHGSCKLIKSIPFKINNFLVKPGDGFWCQKGGHLSNCFGLKSILQLIRQPPVKTLYQSVTYVLATNMQ